MHGTGGSTRAAFLMNARLTKQPLHRSQHEHLRFGLAIFEPFHVGTCSESRTSLDVPLVEGQVEGWALPGPQRGRTRSG